MKITAIVGIFNIGRVEEKERETFYLHLYHVGYMDSNKTHTKTRRNLRIY